MFSKFFIERPIFATVISLVIILAGLVSIKVLPIEQYPSIVPTEIQISATYPGATAEVLADTVAAPIEQELNGVKNMIYMYSTATSQGYLTIGAVFDIGTDPDQATIDVNNKVQMATPKLPSEVTKQGVTVQEKSNSILQVVTMRSTSKRYDTVFVSNYALLNVPFRSRTPSSPPDSLARNRWMNIWPILIRSTPKDVWLTKKNSATLFSAAMKRAVCSA